MQTNLKFPSLLVITDQPPVVFWIRKQLDQNFALIEAATQKEALELIRYTPLDLILIDANIEKVDPLELCSQVRRATPNLPILLITGKLKKSYLEEATEAGASGFLNEQLDAEEFKTKIRSFLP